MSSPVAFTATNRAATTDAADMPHVLGDPADALWAGAAERTNSNFDLIKTWTTAQITALNNMWRPATELTGTGVIAMATNWTATNAYARTLQMGGTAKFVELNLKLTYGGSTYWLGNMANVTMGTLVAGLRPTLSKYMVRVCGSTTFTDPNTAPLNSYYGCDIDIPSTGSVIFRHSSSIAATFSKPGYVHIHAAYFTGIS